MRSELETIYRTAPIGLAILDTELRFLRINQRLAEINGLAAEAHIGRSVRELFPQLADQAEPVLRQVLETGQPVHDVEIRGTTPALPGVERVWVEQFTPIHEDDGRIARISIVAQEVTEQRRAEAALRESRERLALAMEASGEATWDWDVVRDRMRFDGNWVDILGDDPRGTEPPRPDWLARVLPADRERVDRRMAEHVAGRRPRFELEYRVRRADGSWRWLSSRGRVVQRDDTGRPTRVMGMVRDVTAEHEARQRHADLARLVELATDAIFVWTYEHGIEFWNEGAQRQYGFGADEARGVHPNDLLRTEFPVTPEDTEQTLRTEGLWRGELVHHTKDGRRLAVTAVMQRIAEGEVRVLEIARDITEAKQREATLLDRERQLLESRERLKIALEAGRMGVWDWAIGTEQVNWSPETRRLLGIDAAGEGPSPARFLDLVHPEDRAGIDARVARVLSGGGDFESEFRVMRGDGEARWILSRGRVLHDPHGQRSRMVGVHVDITERRAIEEALREADARRTEFLAMLAHELRNPLAPIMNAVMLLERVGDIAERRESATRILRRQTRHLARLVDDLLEVSRITQGRIELRVERTAVAAAVGQAVEAARPLARDRRQTLAVDVPPTLMLVADPARLTQIVSNLVTNAVKYTPEGGHVDITARADSEDWVSIVVSDDGVGVAREMQSRIFELFTQLDRTIDRSEGGLGIGLALVKRLTELHGGHVRCESAGPGTGARFVVCLPRRGRRALPRGHDEQGPTARLPPLSVLVVDDNVDAAESLATLLRMDGHRVEVAFDGEQALAVALGLRPRVLLLDLGLPKLNGLAVAQRLRSDHGFDQTVLVAMSGYAQPADREASAAAGFDAHLAKPVDLAQVYQVIRSALRDELADGRDGGSGLGGLGGTSGLNGVSGVAGSPAGPRPPARG